MPRRGRSKKPRFGECKDDEDWCLHACVVWPFCPCILAIGLGVYLGREGYEAASKRLVLHRLKKKQELRPRYICQACWAHLFERGGDLEGPESGALNTFLDWPANAFGTLEDSERRGGYCMCCRVIAAVLDQAVPGDKITTTIDSEESLLWVRAGNLARPLYLVSPFGSSQASDTDPADNGDDHGDGSGSGNGDDSGDGVAIVHNTVNQLIDWSWAKTWLETCQNEHGGSCSSALEKLWPERPDIRLIDVQEMTLLWPGPADAQYAVLSYVWGGAPKMRFEDTERGSIDLQQCYKSFPRTIRHAIIATRGMGLRYLWVDSICIQSRVARQGVDDMIDDRLRDEDEVSQFADMHKIYGMASICIVAAQGESAEFGLPGVSEQSQQQQQQQQQSESSQVGYELSNIGARPAFIGQLRTNRSIDDEVFIAQSVPLPGKINGSKWATRAWCLQEQLLSRRYLIFYDNQVYFQCSKDMFFEDMPLDRKEELVQYRKRRGKGAGQPPIECRIEKVAIDLASDCPCTQVVHSKHVVVRSAGFEQYENIVSLYSRRDLTFDSDALRAMDGLLSIFRQTMITDMLSGLPERMLDAALLWRGTGALARRSQNASYPRDYLPSWSWAGWRGCISYEPFQEYDVKERAMRTRPHPSDAGRLPQKNLRPFLIWFKSEESQNREPLSGEAEESALVPVNGTGAGIFTRGCGDGEGKRPDEWRAAWSEQSFDATKFPDSSLHRALHPHHLHCWTMQARNYRTSWQSSYRKFGLDAQIRDEQGDAIGELRYDMTRGGSGTGKGGGDDDDDDGYEALTVISEAHHFWDEELNNKFAIHHWPDSFDVYNVLLVHVKEGISTREGIGRVSKRGWGSLRPEWKFVRLA